MKYLVLVYRGQDAADVDDPAALNRANRDWIQARKADGTLEAAYTLLDNASGLIGAGIVNVNSHEALRELLLSYPGYLQAEFEVHPILDAEVAIQQNLNFWKK